MSYEEEEMDSELVQVNVMYISFMLKEVEKLVSKPVADVSGFMQVVVRARLLLQVANKSVDWIDELTDKCLKKYADLRTQADKVEHISNCGYELTVRVIDELAPFILKITKRVREYYGLE